jgi:outer membrane protein
MNKQIFGVLVTIFFLLSAIVHGQTSPQDLGEVLTLKQAVEIAIKNNLVVEQSDIAKQTAQVSRNQQIGYLLPAISGTGTQTISTGRSLNTYTYEYVTQQINYGNYSISANLNIFSGLQTQNSIKQFSLAYEASKLDLEQQKQNITLTVFLNYMQVESSQDLLDISRKQADVDKKQLERLDLQNKDGALLILSDLSDLKGQYATDMANIASAVNALETAKINLFNVLNVPYKRDLRYETLPLDLQMTDYVGNPDSIYRIALSTLPEVKSADLKVKSLQKGVAAARGQYYPQLSLSAGLSSNYSNAATTNIYGATTFVPTTNYITVGGTNYNVITEQQSVTTKNISFGDQFQNNRATFVGLNLSIPILNYLRARNNVKQAKINLINGVNNANSTKFVLQQLVEQAYQNLVMARDQLKSDQDAVDGYAESFRTFEIRFNEGVITSNVYLQAKNNIDRATINLAIAKYNFIFRSKILDYYEGKLNY